MSRPKKKIDWKRVENMVMAGSNGVQVASAIGINEETLYDRCKEDNNVGFSEYLRTKREKGNDMLLRTQFDTALSGDKTMLIWLGKQRLGQREKVDNVNRNIEMDLPERIKDVAEMSEEEMKVVRKYYKIEDEFE